MSLPIHTSAHPSASSSWPSPPHDSAISVLPCSTSRAYNTNPYLNNNHGLYWPNALQLYTPPVYDHTWHFQNEPSWDLSSIMNPSKNYSWLDFCPSYTTAFTPSSPLSSLSSASSSSGSSSSSTSPALPTIHPTGKTQHVVCTAPLIAPVPVPRARPPLLECEELPDMDEDLSHPPYIRRPGKRKRVATDDDGSETNPMVTPLPLKRRAVAITATPLSPVRPSSTQQHRLLPRRVRR